MGIEEGPKFSPEARRQSPEERKQTLKRLIKYIEEEIEKINFRPNMHPRGLAEDLYNLKVQFQKELEELEKLKQS